MRIALRCAALLPLLLGLKALAGPVVEGWQFGVLRHELEIDADPRQELCLGVDGGLPTQRIEPARIAAGAGGSSVRVDLQAGAALGLIENRLRVRPCDGGEDVAVHGLSSFVQSLLDDERPLVDFGSVGLGTRAVIEVPLLTREPGGLRLRGLAAAAELVEVEPIASHNAVSIALPAQSPWGLLGGSVDLEVESAHQNRVRIDWRAQRAGPLIARPERLRLLWRAGAQAPATAAIEIRSADGTRLDLGLVQLVGIEARLQTKPCAVPANNCLRIELQSEDHGDGDGELRVGLAGQDGWLRVPVQQRDGAPFWQAPGPVGPALLPSEPGQRLRQALARASEPGQRLRQALARASEPQEPPGGGPLLSWGVRNEEAVFGYLIYRAEAAEGPFVRINPKIIRADPARGGRYRWRDESADPTRVWYYAVEIISPQGRKAPLTGVLRREPERR